MNAMRPSRLWGCNPLMLVLTFLGGYFLAGRLAWLRALRAGRAPSHSRLIIDHASEAIISTDDAHTIVRANPSAAAMFATSVSAMRGSALGKYIHPLPRTGDGPTAYFGDSAGRAGRRATDHAVTGMRADGATFPLEGSISSLAEAGRPLHTIILRDVTLRQQVQEQLTRSNAQLRQLSAALQTIREEERTHIARELHDDLGQLLAALRMDLALLQKPDPGPGAARLMQGMEENLLTAITSLRRIATNLRPRALDEGGLYFALQGLCNEFAKRHAIACTLRASEAELRTGDAASSAIFRIVQEALTNVARHADATHVSLELHRRQNRLFLTIRDDGRGISAADMAKAESLGLIGMRERVWAMQGEIRITSEQPPGTRIEIVLPLPPPTAAEGGLT